MPTFTNKATLSYNGGVTESNTVTGLIIENLTMNKLSLNGGYGDGDRVTYVVDLINSGTTPFTGLVLTDDLGGYVFDTATVYPLSYVNGSLVYIVNGVPQVAPVPSSVQPLVINGITVPAGGVTTIVYQADITQYAPLDVGGEITNTVTATGAGLTEPVTASTTITTFDTPDLTITKALDPTTVNENGSLTYTFVISNSGNTAAVATDDLVVSDTFDPVLGITSVTLDGTPLALGTGYTYNSVTGLFETVSGVITVPAATFTQNPDGSYTVTPGTTTLTVVGTV